jgi:hypothetical protein
MERRFNLFECVSFFLSLLFPFRSCPTILSNLFLVARLCDVAFSAKYTVPVATQPPSSAHQIQVPSSQRPPAVMPQGIVQRGYRPPIVGIQDPKLQVGVQQDYKQPHQEFAQENGANPVSYDSRGASSETKTAQQPQPPSRPSQQQHKEQPDGSASALSSFPRSIAGDTQQMSGQHGGQSQQTEGTEEKFVRGATQPPASHMGGNYYPLDNTHATQHPDRSHQPQLIIEARSAKPSFPTYGPHGMNSDTSEFNANAVQIAAPTGWIGFVLFILSRTCV